ncbi:sarcosine oxidase subunit beta family protein [Novosphingobium nitrogenifigens DSM 19370]|uniref:Sarcosine oxidase subunit beta family protein n=1 Tax=Novosphingobium nitrogenifigens DSM 19370 TaxID=983920 RepID=F1ZAR3_9SPHN|nr:FAD-binding oxidoreductase [Novosphingobium nitrogenifigens]EGD58300.1 sarcosine oxidase subunit beta family protein [Novosphingobium nitrogenifigens DSM 19370]
MAHTAPQRPLPRSASVIIVGGGIQGLAAAYNLAAEHRFGDVLVLDAGYWQGGASGRNGSLIRGAFGTPEWTGLFRYSAEQWRGLSKRIGHNVMFSQRGYTMVAEKASTAHTLREARKVHAELGIHSELLSHDDIARLLPAIDRGQVSGALHLPDSGIAPHHAAMKGLLAAAREQGVDIRYRTRVTAFERRDNRIAGVWVGDHLVRASTVLVAAGGHNPMMADLAGVTLPGHGTRLEIMALEPLRPVIRPGLAIIDSLCYLHQTPRGEIVGAAEAPESPHFTLRTDIPVMATTASVYLRLFPQLADVRILRHWAGLIHATPDYAPLLGEHPACPGLWFSAGWSYGFAGGPGAGRLMAGAIATGTIDPVMRPFAIDRFDRGMPLTDPTLVL